MRVAVATIVISLLLFVGCGNVWMSPEHAKDYLERHGYTKVVTGGSASMMCGQNGPGGVEFKALDPKGFYVTGAVCENYGGGIVVLTD